MEIGFNFIIAFLRFGSMKMLENNNNKCSDTMQYLST